MIHIPKKTQKICITFAQCRPNVFDVGPTLYKCYTNLLCLLGLVSEDNGYYNDVMYMIGDTHEQDVM